ncbi:MAG: cysteine desulfurase [Clostridia bacterium]|nr:cysteine desulfurase [Clostridia bacterium]
MIYLDSAATTPVCEASAAAVADVLQHCFGNPSSGHFLGVQARRRVEQDRAVIAAKLGCAKEELFFTSGGTEANNLAVFGTVEAAKKYRTKKRIVVSAIEHASVYESAKKLENAGYEVIWLQPDRHGNIAPADLAAAIDENTILVSMMLVNNELGSVLPAAAVKGIIAAKKSPALFHCDCVQAFCKMPFSVKSIGADLVSVSAHKVFGPKGVGALYVRRGVRILPQHIGGEQEKGLRPGTEASALIAGFAAAVDAYDTAGAAKQIKHINSYARQALGSIACVEFNSDEQASESILNISLKGFRSEVILNYLSEKEICVSAGSACAGGKMSHVMKALGAQKDITNSAIRLSFSPFNTTEEIDTLVQALQGAVATLAH